LDAAVEIGIHLAVPDDVCRVFSSCIFSRADDSRVHTFDPKRTMGSCIKCESVLSQLPFKATFPTLLRPTDRFRQIAIFYFAVFAVAWGIFIICSFWGYQRIDLDDEEEMGDSNNPIVGEVFAASATPEIDEVK
jgi:hypothetical protein